MTKHTRTLFLLLFISLAPMMAKAQENGIKDEILGNKDSVTEIISKGRRLLYEKMVAGDVAKVKQIKDYLLNDINNEDYLVFSTNEYWLILYWTREYPIILKNITKRDSFNNSLRGRIRPQHDVLASKLHLKTVAAKQQLLDFIATAGLDNTDKDFLRMNLEYMLTSVQWSQKKQDTLNTMANSFLSKYPKSNYEDYVRKYVRHQLSPARWGVGVEFFSGYGFFTDELKKYYTNSVPIGVAFDVQYKNWVLYLRDFIGFSKTKMDIPYNGGIWKKNSQDRIFLPEASFGYVMTDGRLLKIAPFAGIASTNIGATSYDSDKNPGLDKAGHSFTTTYTFGLNTDIKLGRHQGKEAVTVAKNNYVCMRIRYGYTLPQFERRYGIAGNFHYITIGLTVFGRNVKKEY